MPFQFNNNTARPFCVQYTTTNPILESTFLRDVPTSTGGLYIGDHLVHYENPIYNTSDGDNGNWYMGPDETLGYVIAKRESVPSQARPMFWRTNGKTDAEFIKWTNNILQTSYTTVDQARTGLETNSYYHTYPAVGSFVFGGSSAIEVTDGGNAHLESYGAFTLEWWQYPTSTSNQTIFEFASGLTVKLMQTDLLRIQDGLETFEAEGITFNDDSWHHYIITVTPDTFDGSPYASVTVYQDGYNMGYQLVSPFMFSGVYGPLTIGSSFTGSMSDIHYVSNAGVYPQNSSERVVQPLSPISLMKKSGFLLRASTGDTMLLDTAWPADNTVSQGTGTPVTWSSNKPY